MKENPRLDPEYHAVDFGYLVSGIGIPYSNRVSGIPNSLSCIPDSKAQDSGFHKQKFSRIPECGFP